MDATTAPAGRPKAMSLTTKIMIAMASGLVLGAFLNEFSHPFIDDHIVNGLFYLGGAAFLNALKMLVVPLVTFSLICGVVGIGDIAMLGRMGGKAFGLYLLTTALAVTTAIGIALLIQPGSNFEAQGEPPAPIVAKEAPSVWDVFANIVPTNPINAFAEGNMLQIIFYVILVGVAALMLGKRSEPFIAACTYMNDLMMKVVNIVMAFAPIGVFCLIARTFAEQGIELFIPMMAYVVTLVSALLIHMLVTLMVILKLTTGLNPLTFLTKMRSAQIFAFSTASSNATIPITLQSVEERVGVKNSVASFTVPLGATINMDGTAIMQGVATVFIANISGIDIGLAGYLTVLMMAVLASIGTAGVPGVGLIMLTMVLTQVGLPVEAVALILGVDRLMDMIRTVVNITGDAVVSTVVAKSEGQFDQAVFDDPDAGTIDSDDLDMPTEAKAIQARAERLTPTGDI